MLSVAVLLASCGASWWWWKRRVNENERDVLVLTRRNVSQFSGREMHMQSAPLEVFRCVMHRAVSLLGPHVIP